MSDGGAVAALGMILGLALVWLRQLIAERTAIADREASAAQLARAEARIEELERRAGLLEGAVWVRTPRR